MAAVEPNESSLTQRELKPYTSLHKSSAFNAEAAQGKIISDSGLETTYQSPRDDSGYGGSSSTEKEVEANATEHRRYPPGYSLGDGSKNQGLSTYQNGCYNVDIEAKNQSQVYVGTSYFTTFQSCCSPDRRNCPNCVSANGNVGGGNSRWTCKLADGDISCGSLFLTREALIGHFFTVHQICDYQHMFRALNVGAVAENIVRPEYSHHEPPSAQVPSVSTTKLSTESRVQPLNPPGRQSSYTSAGGEAYNNDRIYSHPDPQDYVATASASTKALTAGTLNTTQSGNARVFTCAACQHRREECKWIDGHSRCSSCQHHERACTLAVAGLDIACHLSAVLEELDMMSASEEFRRLFTGIYTDYGPSVAGFKLWADYKNFILSENSPRILRTTIIAHQLQDFEQRVLQGQRLRYNSVQVHGGHAGRQSMKSAKQNDSCFQLRASCHTAPDNDKSSVMCHDGEVSADNSDASPAFKTGNDPVSDMSISDSLQSDLSSISDSAVNSQTLHAAKVYTMILLHLVQGMRKQASQGAIRSRPNRDNQTASKQGNQAHPPTSRQSNGKRKLEPHARKNFNNTSNNREEEEEDDDGSSMRPPAKKLKQEVPDIMLSFACPFHKKDPIMYSIQNTNEEQAERYQKCGSCLHRTIAALKQHLKRKHTMPEHYCPTCWEVFEDSSHKNDHLRAQSCAAGENPFKDRMTEDMFTAIKKKVRSEDAVATWYNIFEILFPNHQPRPSSPYTGGPISELHSFALALIQRLGPRANQVYAYLRDGNNGPQLLPLHAEIVDQAFTFFASTIAASPRAEPPSSPQDASNLDSQPTLVNSTSQPDNDAMKPPPAAVFGAPQDTLAQIGSDHHLSGSLQDIAIADAISRTTIPIYEEGDTSGYGTYGDILPSLESINWNKIWEETMQIPSD